ncbi:MAG: FAD-dependent oxidoreductase [Actinobacteria bacterium]|nr:FAD-dependent oxidoreductase [Actinomycetota bacterium]MBO0785877.1 FAD-dependent oxidoreductase [Actinomycetota bacterium]MBO0816584.1 FAD-dependent oxidoreductase [Actinomycetota bacterium]
MPAEPAYVIVGASLTGGKAAETLREEGFGGPIVLLGTEPERPYERPPLSKGYLLGKEEKSSVYVHDQGWYAEHDVDLRTGVTVTAVDPAAGQVTLDSGETIGYDRLLLATGASPRRLNVPGGDLGGVLYLRTVAESEHLGSVLRHGGKVAIAGAGWIGLEVAAAAREFGCEVTVIEPEPVALHRALGPELGGMFTDLHREHGVTFRFGEGLSEIRGSGGSAAAVVTSAGAEVPADAVVIAVGVRPNTGLAADAGLDISNGVTVDAAMRTSVPGIYAAGDVADVFNSLLGRRVRVEHWANALSSGPAAARAMLGQPVSYDQVPYFFTDQYDLGMETAGLPEPGGYDQVVYRGDRAGREFIAFWLSGGAVVAGMNVNVWDVSDDIQDLIRSKRQVDTARLTDPDTPLNEL